MRIVATTRFQRRKLPHWEIANGRYFVTIRLADSLPTVVLLQLREIHASLSLVESNSILFSTLQRRYFATLERHLDTGMGACLLRDARLAGIVAEELVALQDWQVAVPHYTIMPNHWHALVVPSPSCQHPLAAIMKRIKGRSALRIRRARRDQGQVWQSET